ncbi:hypothetical protein Q2941_37200 [Bradyrhizobium sp. UFLA05-153]
MNFYDGLVSDEGDPLNVKAMMATILQNQMALLGVHSLTASDYEEIVDLLIDQLSELELRLAELDVTHKPEPPEPR